MQFKAEGRQALDTAISCGASYADVRFERTRTERIEVRNGIISTLVDARSCGYGIRALVDGAWGFAASADLSKDGLDRAAALAVAIARASASIARTRIGEAPSRAYTDSYATPVSIEPDSVSLGDCVAMLLAAERAVRSTPEVAVGRAFVDLWNADKFFFSTIGSEIQQRITQSGSGVQAMAVGDGDVQTRSFPGDNGLYKGGGWEIVKEAQLVENAARIGEEATALLRAPQCPSGTLDLILGGSQMSLQIHESCGHPAELDRVMGWEANFSGTSFLELGQLDKLKYGSPIVNIVIDNTLAHGMATCGYDDEGTKSGVSDIIAAGILRGYEMSNDTARAIGRESNACVRAQSWDFVPMIRMCNLNLLPGDTPFENLFDDVKDGIYMESNRSWSIYDHRLNFQFGCEIAWEIKNGKRGRMLKNPTYAGMTPKFWNSCDAIADKDSWVAWGTPNCGKG